MKKIELKEKHKTITKGMLDQESKVKNKDLEDKKHKYLHIIIIK